MVTFSKNCSQYQEMFLFSENVRRCEKIVMVLKTLKFKEMCAFSKYVHKFENMFPCKKCPHLQQYCYRKKNLSGRSRKRVSGRRPVPPSRKAKEKLAGHRSGLGSGGAIVLTMGGLDSYTLHLCMTRSYIPKANPIISGCAREGRDFLNPNIRHKTFSEHL